jgi:hypothetical protein
MVWKEAMLKTPLGEAPRQRRGKLRRSRIRAHFSQTFQDRIDSPLSTVRICGSLLAQCATPFWGNKKPLFGGLTLRVG